MERKEIQKYVLEGMVHFSNEMYMATIFNRIAKSYDGYLPISFKPSLGDRMLFRQIVERRMGDIEKQMKKFPEMDKDDFMHIGFKLLIEEFYPKYGEYIQMNKAEWQETHDRLMDFLLQPNCL